MIYIRQSDYLLHPCGSQGVPTRGNAALQQGNTDIRVGKTMNITGASRHEGVVSPKLLLPYFILELPMLEVFCYIALVINFKFNCS